MYKRLLTSILILFITFIIVKVGIYSNSESSKLVFDDLEIDRITDIGSIYSFTPNMAKVLNVNINRELKKGDSNNDVKQLKLDLAIIGFKVSNNPNNNFGPSTEGKVKEFQSYYGLNATGIVDKGTANKINAILDSPFRKGKSHQDVIGIKRDLEILGFKVSNNPNKNYGPTTEKKVKEFQTFYKLKDNGIVDPITRNKIKELLETPLKRGVSRSDVITLKLNLEKLGFKVSNNPNKNFGPSTEKKVKEFQSYYGITVDGIVYKETTDTINNILSSPFQKGKSHQDVISLKKDIAKLGFKVSNNPNKNFGPSTEKKVKEFQKYYKLMSNGIVDPITKNKITELLSTPMKKGDKRKDVINLKLNLAKLGFKVSNSPNENFGPTTEGKVKEFQRYYGVNETGIADKNTFSMINEILSSPFQNGKKHKDTIQLKKDLEKLNYGYFKYKNSSYGPQTKGVVEKFQKSQGLVVNGIVDPRTREAINKLLKDKNKTEYTEYQISLDEAVGIQYNARATPITDKYRNDPAYVSAKSSLFQLAGRVTGSVVNVRTTPYSSNSNNINSQLYNGDIVAIVGEVQGTNVGGNTVWYKISIDGKSYYIHSGLATNNLGIIKASVLNVRSGQGTNNHIFGTLKKGQVVTIVKKGSSWHQISYGSWRKPSKSDIKGFLDPTKNDKMQHLRLDSLVGVSASELNNVLKGKGTLANQGQAFINGAKKHGINEAYLIAHAILESGNGGSTLANGVEVGLDQKGDPTRVTSSNRSNLKDIKKTYNMFGIGAVDSNALNGGSETAYKEGWFTPALAIEGGAEWIGNGYIYNDFKQNTLYKMKWNPRMNAGYEWKQYATDIAWATKQVPSIKNIYNQLNNPSYHYDIAKYK